MLSENAIDNLVQPIVDRQESINIMVITKIAGRLKEIGTLEPADIDKLNKLAIMGNDVREINKEISRISGLQVSDIKSVIKTVAAESYKDAKPFYDYRHKSYIPFEKNEQLQKIVRAVGKETVYNYTNLSNSKATGFMIRDPKNPLRLHFRTINDTYKQVIDEAIQAAQSGVVDTRTAINNAIKQLLASGIRRMYWDSGYTQRLDTAVRRNVLDGIRAINQQIQDETGRQFRSDGKELSAHSNSAPDHEPFQGHIFTNHEWNNLQSSADFEDINGEKFNGVERIIGVWNCHHVAYAIIIGAQPPRYTKDQLQKMKEDNAKGVTLKNGKHLSGYECTQMQRRLETRIRYAKEEQMAMKELGNINAARIARAKVKNLTNEYKSFSKEVKLPIKKDRISIPGYKYQI